jgi:hypothetical protein
MTMLANRNGEDNDAMEGRSKAVRRALTGDVTSRALFPRFVV